jgi:hypothetical protein
MRYGIWEMTCEDIGIKLYIYHISYLTSQIPNLIPLNRR